VTRREVEALLRFHADASPRLTVVRDLDRSPGEACRPGVAYNVVVLEGDGRRARADVPNEEF
jgi:hypothetical protein